MIQSLCKLIVIHVVIFDLTNDSVTSFVAMRIRITSIMIISSEHVRCLLVSSPNLLKLLNHSTQNYSLNLLSPPFCLLLPKRLSSLPAPDPCPLSSLLTLLDLTPKIELRCPIPVRIFLQPVRFLADSSLVSRSLSLLLFITPLFRLCLSAVFLLRRSLGLGGGARSAVAVFVAWGG